jgi:hypothetical protein
MLKNSLIKVQILLVLGAMLLVACGGNVPEATPTLDAAQIQQIQTQAVATFSSALTLTALVAPTNTPLPTPIVPVATNTSSTPFAALTTPGVPVSGAATASCYGLTFVQDITIKDNTVMDPGKSFTKTWQVQNSGSCAWDAGFKFQSTGGDPMGATAFTLPAAVASGATYEISVPMTAPSSSGTVRGNWRMSTASGQFFGDEVYVIINVGGSGTTATETSSAPAATATPTQ